MISIFASVSNLKNTYWLKSSLQNLMSFARLFPNFLSFNKSLLLFLIFQNFLSLQKLQNFSLLFLSLPFTIVETKDDSCERRGIKMEYCQGSLSNCKLQLLGPHQCGVTEKDPIRRYKIKKNLQMALTTGGISDNERTPWLLDKTQLWSQNKFPQPAHQPMPRQISNIKRKLWKKRYEISGRQILAQHPNQSHFEKNK